ncbi:hypothetical protein ABEB36_009201 [Hypothenemus hampei]|uniref:Uncharacterized protein n=1 Tax=Hypothenemus hampei TaxID=57062 RepID=A0ABD1EPG3_HYPHA
MKIDSIFSGVVIEMQVAGFLSTGYKMHLNRNFSFLKSTEATQFLRADKFKATFGNMDYNTIFQKNLVR